MVDNQQGDLRVVEYAADVPTSIFGSAFGKKGQKVLSPLQEEYEKHMWNLNNLPSLPNSLMQFPRLQDINGINLPWLYIGMRYATFCWHYEDLMLNSINYHHWGAPKQWYCVPEHHREKFEKAAKKKLAGLTAKDPNLLLDMVTVINPVFLKQNGVSLLC